MRQCGSHFLRVWAGLSKLREMEGIEDTLGTVNLGNRNIQEDGRR